MALDDPEVIPDAPLQVGDGDCFPFEQSFAAGNPGLYFVLRTPPPDGAGLYIKDTGDLTGGQHRAFRLPGVVSTLNEMIFHQVSPLTVSGSGVCPNQ
jgi:hypothetical protein